MSASAAALVTSDVLVAASADAATMGGDELNTTLPVAAGLAYELFADLEAIPFWLSIVRSVRVVTRSGDGRPRQVSFMAALERATIGYTVDYAFDDLVCRVTWATRGGSSMQVAGEARFTPLGDRACMMYYRLGLSVPSVGAWGDPSFDGHAASAVVHDFRDHVRRAQ
jgi:uncharacterized membrane protein